MDVRRRLDPSQQVHWCISDRALEERDGSPAPCVERGPIGTLVRAPPTAFREMSSSRALCIAR